MKPAPPVSRIFFVGVIESIATALKSPSLRIHAQIVLRIRARPNQARGRDARHCLAAHSIHSLSTIKVRSAHEKSARRCRCSSNNSNAPPDLARVQAYDRDFIFGPEGTMTR